MHWLNLSAFVVGGLVRLIKSDRLDAYLAAVGLGPVPTKALPWISLGLGCIAGVIAALMVPGMDWSTAIQQGLVSGLMAIGGHELVIESMRDGKEFPPRPDQKEEVVH